MKVFGVDLGSVKVGWSYMDGPDLLSVGVWHLTSKLKTSLGYRWLILEQRLREVIKVSALEIDLVSFEEVRHHKGVDAAHAYGGSEAFLLAWCERNRFEYSSVTVQDVKGAATGKRGGKGSSKAHVLAAARARWPRHTFETDDAADAAFIGLAAQINLGLIQPVQGKQRTIF